MGKYKADLRIILHCTSDIEGDTLREALSTFYDQTDEEILHQYFENKIHVTCFEVEGMYRGRNKKNT